MQRSVYLKPVGIYPAPPEDSSAEKQVLAGLPLAGGRLHFSALEVAERKGAEITRRVAGLTEFFERDWGRHTMAAGALLDEIRSPRARLAGLALEQPRIMGIVNVTPDSFSDGGRHDTTEAAVAHGLRLVAEGAEILDIGGESTRPGADDVSVEEEVRRVIPVIEGLRAKTDVRISIDTRKAEVMRRAARAGADILNDVSALMHDPEAMEAAAESGLPVILMHAQGDPKTMNDDPQYSDVVLDVFDFLEQRVAACEAAGIPKSKLVVDPGIGFGKHLHHNVAMMAGIGMLHGIGVPILLGASRKKMIGQLCDVAAPDDRVPGSLATMLFGVAQGVQVVRVHDVAATRQALMVWLASAYGSEKGIA